MKNYPELLVLLLITFCVSIFGQNSIKTDMVLKNLPKDIIWKQLLSNKNTSFVVGFQNSEAVLYNLESDTSLIISKIGQRKFVFLSDNFIYIGFVGACSEKNISEDRIMVFDLNGKFKKTLNVSCSGFIINYILQFDERDVFFTSIDIDEYTSGKTNGILNCALYNIKNLKPVLKFSQKQSPPPNRISLPVISKKDNKIYVAFEDKYNIDIYSSRKKIKSFTLPNFHAKPYSSDEIKLLSTMQQSGVQEGISYPPVIMKIEIDRQGIVFVTRYPRPGDKKIFVDLFESEGKFIKTYEFTLNKNEQFIDGCLTPRNDYILLKSLNNAEYSITMSKIYK